MTFVRAIYDRFFPATTFFCCRMCFYWFCNLYDNFLCISIGCCHAQKLNLRAKLFFLSQIPPPPQKNYCPQNFLDPKYSLTTFFFTKHFFDLISFNPSFVWTKDFFDHFFCPQIFFTYNFVLALNFWAKLVLDLEFLDQKFVGLKINSIDQFIRTQILFLTKYRTYWPYWYYLIVT